MTRSRVLLAGAAVAAALGVVAPRLARACGGFFCSQPQQNAPLPIAQAAENVLFVLDTVPNTGVRRVEAHVQILYTGPASEFSWIVPVTAVPTVDVGWDILFDRIEPPTRPSFQLTYQVDGRCSDFGSDSAGCGSTVGSAGGSATTGTGGGSGSINGPVVEVVARGSVGPFDYVVVRSENGSTLRT